MFKKLLVSLLLLPMMAFSSQSPDAAKIEEATQYFMKKYGAQLPDPVINNIAQQAISDCGINNRVIILQNNNDDNSCVDIYRDLYEFPFIIIGTKNQSLDQITFNTYHECGHLHYDDVKAKRKRLKQLNIFHAGTAVLTVGTLVSLLKVKNNIFKKCVIGGVGITAGIISYFGGISVFNTINRPVEMRADSFAYEKLLKAKKYDAILENILYNIVKFEFDKPRYTKATPFNTHPCAYERAANAIEILRKNNIDPADPEQVKKLHTDEGLINNLPRLVAQYFGKK